MTRTLALLMSDVEGSTALWRRSPQEMDHAMTRHHALVDEVRVAFGAQRPRDQGEGDSAFLAFDRADDAVAAALHLQLALAREPWPEACVLRVRIAVGMGPVIPRDSNLFGDTVNRTARLRGLAHGGQTVLSAAVREQVHDALPEGVRLVDLGLHRVKDVPEPQRVFQLNHPELPAQFPALRSLDPAGPALPRPLTGFVGRTADLAELRELVMTGRRLVTITGSGGVGKTRLALQLAAELAEQGRSLCWVDLSSVTESDAVPAAVGAALGVRDDGESMAVSVAQHLADRELLLLLDNIEQVLDCRAWLRELLERCPHLLLVATSREPLALQGEEDFRLTPLPVPADDTEADQSPSVQLFVQQAAAVRRGFTLDEGTRGPVIAICRLVEGVPLALELAAAQVRTLAPVDLLGALAQGLTTLRSSHADTPARHRSLRDTIAWSVDLLTDDEQALLRALSALPAAATLAAVTDVCAGAAAPERVVELLERLVTKSLVVRDEDRYRLLTSVREYAGEQLSTDEHAILLDRHSAHYLGRSIEGAAVADSPLSKAWDAERRRDEAHLRAAIEHAHAQGHAEQELTMVANLADLWLELHLRDGISLLARARACASAAGVQNAGLLAFSASLQAFLLAWAGDLDAGLPVAEQGLTWAGEPGARGLLPFAYQARAEVQTGAAARRADLERAIALAGRAPDDGRWGGARAESVQLGAGSSLCRLEHYRDPPRARAAAAELLERARLAGRLPDVAGALLLLAVLAVDVGDLPGAETQLRTCLHELESSDTVAHQRAHARMLLALVRDLRGEHDGPMSIDLAGLADELEAAGLATYALDVLLRLGERQAMSGREREAVSTWSRCEALAERSGSVRVAWPRWRLARMRRLAGSPSYDDLRATWRALRPHAGRFLPEALSLLVEAAAAADAAGDARTAGELMGHLHDQLGPFVLAPLVSEDLDRLLTAYAATPPRPGLPDELPVSG